MDTERRDMMTRPDRMKRSSQSAMNRAVAMFIATTSLFQGQEQVFPKSLEGSLWLQLPALWVIAVTLYWLTRLALRKPPRPLPRNAASHVRKVVAAEQ